MQALCRAFKCNLLCYLFDFFFFYETLLCILSMISQKSIVNFFIQQRRNTNTKWIKDTNLTHLMSSLLTDYLLEEWMMHVQPCLSY